MRTTRALLPAIFSLALAFLLPVGCGSIEVSKPDGAAGSSAGGTGGATGAAGSGMAGTTGAGGSSAGRGGSDGRGGAAGSSAGRGGSAGAGNGGRGGGAGSVGNAGSGGAGGRGGAAGSGAGRGGAGGTAAGGRGGGAGTGAAGRGGSGGTGGGPCICPTIIKPVCGVNGVTYNNDCEAACANVAVAYDGMCVMECKSNADCVHYPDGVGDCCGACLPTSAARPAMVSCFGPCMMPITCPCVVGKCLATSAGAAAQ